MADQYKVVLTKRADEDLNSILHYLLSKFGKSAATRAMEGIEKCMQSIGKMPEAHSIWLPGKDRLTYQYRYKIANKQHRILYRLHKTDNMVLVARIINKSMSSNILLTSIEEE